MIDTSPHPHAAIRSAWNRSKIVHRRVAINEVRRIVVSSKVLPAELNSLVLAAAADPDLSVREVAFCILRQCKHPALPALAAAQLRDCDPEVRLLGLDYLRWVGAGVGIPAVVPALDDSDPVVVVTSLKLLEKWTTQRFGVKLTEIAPAAEGEKSGLRDLREGAQTKSKAGADRAKGWWAEHRSEFTSVPLEAHAAGFVAPKPLVAGEFELPALDSREGPLSDFRGRVVLLHSEPGPLLA